MLDFLRFVAAAMVLVYHYTFRAAVDNAYSLITFPELDPFTRYGSLGVDLFFIISGFVILMTVDAGHGDPARFVASRISRLFPAFWAAATLTFIATLVLAPTFAVSLKDYVFNLGMFPSWLGASYVDGVYWTLETELSFYLLVLVYLMFFWKRLRLEWVLLAWLIVAVPMALLELGPGRLRTLLVVDSAPFFIAGATFYLIWRDGWSGLRALLLGGTWLSAAIGATREASAISVDFGVEVSPYVSAALVTCGFLVFLALVLRPTWLRLGGGRAVLLGALTYPLYLVHQKVGYIVLNAMGPEVGRWGGLVIAVATALIVAYLINRYVERRYNARLRRWLEPRLAGLDHVSVKTRAAVRSSTLRTPAAKSQDD